MPYAFVVVALAVACGAALDLALPFAGDQALFALGAREMLGGAVLYVDFWDLKQPGIYAFFALARSLFRAGPVAVAVLQGCWDAALAVVVARIAWRTAATRAVWFVAPLLAVVYAQVVRTYEDAAQVEALAGLPLALALLGALEARDARRGRAMWAFGAGLAVAVVLLFKVLFAIVVAATLAAAIVARERDAPDVRPAPRAIATAILAFAGGLSLALGATLAWFGAHGALGAALATWFVIPPRVVREIPHQPIAFLVRGIVEYVRTFAPIVALACVGAVASLRARAPSLAAAFAWLVSAVVVVLVQTTSWSAYQWRLLDVPLALLATAGIAALLRANARGRVLVAGVLLVAVVAYPLVHARAKLALLARESFGTTVSRRLAIEDAFDPQAAIARDEALRIRARTTGDPYVFGNPLVYEVLGARQPIALNGWSPELLIASQRRELLRELRRTRPQVVFIARALRPDYDRLVARSPEIAAYLSRAYAADETRTGTLLVRR